MVNWFSIFIFVLSASLTFAFIDWIKKKYLYEDKDQDQGRDDEEKDNH